eukprot:scaffold27379_cov24-Tisochrysis_lutea.AAC.1
MEGDRKSYAEEVQNVVRKQKAQIEKLKRENNQLKSELSLETRAATVGSSGVVSTKLTALQDAQELAARTIEAEKRRGEELDMRLRALKEQLLQEKKEMGGNNGHIEQHHAVQKQVKVLEHRLHRSLVKFNEAISANKELREIIDNLRRERVVFDGIYKKMQNNLAEKKKKMADIIEVANVAYEARDRAHAEINNLRAQAEKEQAEFEVQWKELGLQLEEDRRRQEALARERAKALTEANKSAEDDALNKASAKGGRGSSNGNDDVASGMEKVASYEEAFAQIQTATGIEDIDQLVNNFIENEDGNFKMFNYLNELNSDIEKAEDAIQELKKDAENFRGKDRGAASQRKRMMKDLADRVSDTEAKAAQYEETLKTLNGSIASIIKIIEGLTVKLGCNSRLLNEMGAEGGGCNEQNMMVYMGVIEQRANELLSAHLQQTGGGGVASSLLRRDAGMESGSARGTNSRPSIAVPTTADDGLESDDSDEDDQRPLSRQELHARTLRGLAKRESSTKKATNTNSRRGSGVPTRR